MKKSNAFLLASLAATSSLLFHTQEAKAGINDEWSIKMPGTLILLKATSGRYKGDYVIRADFSDEFHPEPTRPVGKDKKRAKKSFKQFCKSYKNWYY